MTELDENWLSSWLREGDPWTRYRTLVGLCHRDPSIGPAVVARREIAAHPNIKKLVSSVNSRPWPPLTSHKNADHPIHKLAFLADLGLSEEELGISTTITDIVDNASAEGPFQTPMKIGTSYGGSGEINLAWALCDAPLLAYAFIKFGHADSEPVKEAIEYMISLVRSNGWPCVVSSKLGKFRGPGRKDDPCPYANLVMLKLLSQMPKYRSSDEARIGTEAALELWSQGRTRHPYMFYMGEDFRKLKMPFVWYDIMHVAEVLTKFPSLRKDERLAEMIDVILSKADTDGRFTPESVWTAWKQWEFGQKKEPSRWLTLHVCMLRERIESR
ncbi:MAG: hypothetical protein LUQ27_02140 [Methanomassiliicoccales archaeon]|nr:hypothetical protein [Methanomassiliicoccales archaeon]